MDSRTIGLISSGDSVQSKLARFNLREIENVVDDAQEMMCAGLNVADIASIALGSKRAEHLARHGFRETNNRVHRGAEFVAHIGQEIGFGPIGYFRTLDSGLQFEFSPLFVCDIVHDNCVVEVFPASSRMSNMEMLSQYFSPFLRSFSALPSQ